MRFVAIPQKPLRMLHDVVYIGIYKLVLTATRHFRSLSFYVDTLPAYYCDDCAISQGDYRSMEMIKKFEPFELLI